MKSIPIVIMIMVMSTLSSAQKEEFLYFNIGVNGATSVSSESEITYNQYLPQLSLGIEYQRFLSDFLTLNTGIGILQESYKGFGNFDGPNSSIPQLDRIYFRDLARRYSFIGTFDLGARYEFSNWNLIFFAGLQFDFISRYYCDGSVKQDQYLIIEDKDKYFLFGMPTGFRPQVGLRFFRKEKIQIELNFSRYALWSFLYSPLHSYEYHLLPYLEDYSGSSDLEDDRIFVQSIGMKVKIPLR